MRQSALWLVVLFLLIAAFLRISQLHTYPPGPHYDEAANVLITRSIAFGGANLFPIANSYQGRESLFFYLNVPLFRLIANDIFSMRLASVYINMLTVAASIGLGRIMFRGKRGIVIGLVIGLTMTASFHQVFMGRQAFRAVTLPLMQALGLFFLWQGLRRNARQSLIFLIAAGFFSAGALYTYMASRLFPLWLLLGGICLIWIDRKNWRLRLSQGSVFFVALALFSVPLMSYAIHNPDIFFQRLTEVTGGDYHASLSESLLAHLKMFFIEGDHGNLRYNAPRRPYFTVPEGLLLFLGLLIAFYRLTKSGHPLEKAAYFMALLSPLMVIPSVVATGEIPPSHMRSLGMVPLIFVLIALGAEWLYMRMQDFLKQGAHTRFAVYVFAISLVGLSAKTYADYFNWAERVDLFYQTDGDLAAAAEWLNGQPDLPVYVAAFHREHPTIMIGTDKPVTWLGDDSLMLPRIGEEGIILFAHDLPSRQNWQSILGEPLTEGIPVGPDGGPAFWAYSIEADDTALSIEQPSAQIQNDFMSFLGLQRSTLVAGETGTITMAWRIDQTPPYAQLRPIVSLENADGIQITSADAFPRQTDRWREGELLLQQLAMSVPVGTVPGIYHLQLMWVDRITQTFLPFVSEDSTFSGISAEIGTILVEKPDDFPSPAILEIPVRYDEEIFPGGRLLGWNFLPLQRRPGEAFDTSFYWAAEEGISEQSGLGAQLMLQGNQIIELDGDPFYYPPLNWDAGELITLRNRWQLPRDVPSGDYVVMLTILDRAIEVGKLQIDGIPRLLDPPGVDTVMETQFSDNTNLFGYTIGLQDSATILELVWFARDLIQPDYTVFVHLVNEDGVIIEQRDSMPVNNSYPTSLWIAGEYIIDIYSFDYTLQPGYQFRVGLYIQATGDRQKLIIDGLDSEYEYIHIVP